MDVDVGFGNLIEQQVDYSKVTPRASASGSYQAYLAWNVLLDLSERHFPAGTTVQSLLVYGGLPILRRGHWWMVAETIVLTVLNLSLFV